MHVALLIFLTFLSNSKKIRGLPSITRGSLFGRVCIPGDLVLSFSIPLKNSTTLAYSVYDPHASNNFFPLVVWAVNFLDAWQRAALFSHDSIDDFFRSDMNLGNAHYLFVAMNDESEINLLKSMIDSRISTLGIYPSKSARVLYGNYTLKSLGASGSAITNTLNQWPSYVNYINFSYTQDSLFKFEESRITRLDCYWPYCFGPSSIVKPVALMDGGDGCNSLRINTTQLSSIFLIVSADACGPGDAALNVQSIGARGALVMMRQGAKSLSQINKNGTLELNIYVTSISYEDGILVQNIISREPSKSINITFYSDIVPGYFMVIDTERKIRQLGAPLNAEMMLASWATQYEYYRTELYANLSLAAYVVPVIDDMFMRARSRPISIDFETIRQYGTMVIDTTITCPGNFDGECSGWDHTVTLTVACSEESSSEEILSAATSATGFDKWYLKAGEVPLKSFASDPSLHSHRRLEVGGSNFELARYITPFGRRTGQWLTDASQLLPLLTHADCSSFVFEAAAGGSPWIVSTNLRFSDRNKPPPAGLVPLYSVFEYFRPEYNRNRTIPVRVPKGTANVVLVATITTHGYDAYGCCEFLPTAHIFSVNGVDFDVRFTEAGSAWGCSDMASSGSEPNEYGTWWYGRGGWCDGMDVKPHILNVTSAINFKDLNANFISYRAMMLFNGTWVPPQSAMQTGYVILSSHLVYYSNTSSPGSVSPSHTVESSTGLVVAVSVVGGLMAVGIASLLVLRARCARSPSPFTILATEESPVVAARGRIVDRAGRSVTREETGAVLVDEDVGDIDYVHYDPRGADLSTKTSSRATTGARYLSAEVQLGNNQL